MSNTFKRSKKFKSRDRRSFMELREDISHALTKSITSSALVLEYLLINEQISDHLVDAFTSSVEANNAFRIMFKGAYEDELYKRDPIPFPKGADPKTMDSQQHKMFRKLKFPTPEEFEASKKRKAARRQKRA